jgi:hypothetical protein
MIPKFSLTYLLPLFIVGLSSAWLVGCDSSSDDDAATATGLSGNWKITQTSSTGTTDTVNVKITQDGNNISVSSWDGTLPGSVSGTNLQFTIRTRVPADPLAEISASTYEYDEFTGEVIDDNVLAGTYEKTTKSGSLIEKGSWVANR